MPSHVGPCAPDREHEARLRNFLFADASEAAPDTPKIALELVSEMKKVGATGPWSFDKQRANAPDLLPRRLAFLFLLIALDALSPSSAIAPVGATPPNKLTKGGCDIRRLMVLTTSPPVPVCVPRVTVLPFFMSYAPVV